MTPAYTDDTVTLYGGDCLNVLATLPDASVDAVVTDPPYLLGFMGREWDTRAAADHLAWHGAWSAQCLRVLKPGGHLLAFGGTRTYHRLACAVEDAGFEIRDSITWLYSTGFPKSLAVGKNTAFCQCPAIPYSHVDKGSGVDLPGMPDDILSITDEAAWASAPGVFPSMPRQAGRGPARCDQPARCEGACGETTSGDEAGGEPGLERRGDAQAPEGELQGRAIRAMPGGTPLDGADQRLHHGAPAGHGPLGRETVAPVGVREPHRPQPGEQRPVEPRPVAVERGSQTRGGWPVCERCSQPVIPAGLGTALKPASEPIVVARKPLTGTVAGNVLAYGTGALNIDGCRVEHDASVNLVSQQRQAADTAGMRGIGDGGFSADHTQPTYNAAGRWPANVVLTHIPDCNDVCAAGCPVAELDQQSGTLTSGKPSGLRGANSKASVSYADIAAGSELTGYGDSGGASRFFPTFRYQAKAPASQRPKLADGTAHPTVKPLDLMRWLVRLVTPPGGTVLDPFAGSGTTLEAATLEGFTAVGVERDDAYLAMCRARLAKPVQGGLFGEAVS